MWKYYQWSSSSPLKMFCEVMNFKVKCPSAPFTILLFSQTDRREAAEGLEEKDVHIMKRPNTSGLIQPSRNRKTVLQLRGGPRSEPLLVSADPSHSDSRWHCSVGEHTLVILSALGVICFALYILTREKNILKTLPVIKETIQARSMCKWNTFSWFFFRNALML